MLSNILFVYVYNCIKLVLLVLIYLFVDCYYFKWREILIFQRPFLIILGR